MPRKAPSIIAAALAALASAAPAHAATVGVQDGRLVIAAASGEENRISVARGADGALRVADAGVPLAVSAGCRPLPIAGVAGAVCGALQVTGVTVIAGDGDDHVLIDTSAPAGTRGAAEERHQVDGGDGDDQVEVRGGESQVRGGDGDDGVRTGDGDDAVDGGAGEDKIDGGAGDDTIVPGCGSDQAEGGAGADRMRPGHGPEHPDASDCHGEADDDILDGGPGDDAIDGGLGDDLLDGGPGRDDLRGGPGVDDLLGGSGDDALGAVDGRPDNLSGGPGRDRASADRADLFAGGGGDVERVVGAGAAAQGAVAGARTVGLPSALRCTSGGTSTIRIALRRGLTWRSAAVHVDGLGVRTVRGDRLHAGIDLAGLPEGRYTVEVVATAGNGTRATGRRSYSTCRERLAGGRPEL